MSESTLWPEERNKGTSQRHGEDQQEERKAWKIIHIYSCSNKTGLIFYKRSSDCEHSKNAIYASQKKKGNSRSIIPLSQSWCADQEELSTRRSSGAMKDAT